MDNEQTPLLRKPVDGHSEAISNQIQDDYPVEVSGRTDSTTSGAIH